MITRSILGAVIAAFVFMGCSSKKESGKIEYKIQQKNSQKAFDEL